MTFLKSLWSDLVEKRLWPVAVVLLAALVAIPVALGDGGDTAPAVAPAATGATGGEAALSARVALDPAGPVRRDRLGKVRDPFQQREVPEAPDPGAGAAQAPATAGGGGGAAASATPPAQPAAAASGDGGAGGGGTGGGGGGAATPPPDAGGGDAGTPRRTVPKLEDSYVVEVRFGRRYYPRRKREVERLTPLPATDDPAFVFLGVLKDEKTAVFLLSSDVKATGDGTCKPRESSCETVELRKGDTAFLDITADNGSVRAYQLDVMAIEKQRGDTPSRAVAARAGEDEANFESDAYRVDPKTGLLGRVIAPAALRAAKIKLRAELRAAKPYR